jgi:isocitrate dehydrogenase
MNIESRSRRTITVIEGDGVGPEITSLTVDLMRASGAIIDVELAEAGGVAFAGGIVSGRAERDLGCG